jgi:L-ribulose-5-phosphate 3-epimerase
MAELRNPLGRRDFLRATAAVTAAFASGSTFAVDAKPRLKKAVKFGMIRVPNGTYLQRLELAKKCGFQGVEIDSPGTANLDELLKARDATGMVIHGVIDSVHWKDTLSSPEEEVRARGLKALQGAIADAKTVGADTVLLVPGVARNGVTYEQCWERSQAEVRKAIPAAESAKIKIAIETVWNDFITKPEQMIEYVDSFKSPWVGAYFDVSNMLKYGVSSPEWIRKLGKRMVKFDFKGYSLEMAKAAGNPGAGFKAKIGEGDENWPEILRALDEVGYTGWFTAEVGGGGEDVLMDISKRMDKILGV